MKKSYAAICVFVLTMALSAGKAAHAEPWTMKEFMISVWGGPRDEAMAGAYRDAHFNTVMAAADKLEMCGRYGLKAIVMSATPEIASQNKDNPNVWGWFVRDEPKEAEYEATAVPVAALHNADPNHPAYVNMVSSYEVDSYLKTVNPRIMSYDYYQWWWGTFMQFFFLDKYRRAAEQQGVPLIVWVEANADPKWEYGKPGAGYLPDNAAKLRQSVFTALAYGAKGIQWFVEPLVFKSAPDKSGLLPELSPAGEDIAKINAELSALGPELMKLKCTGVFHTVPYVYEKKPMPLKDRWASASGKNITVGMFTDGSGGRYAMVVNRDITMKSEATLNFEGKANKISRFDRWKRQWVEESTGDTVKMELNPGDGELVRVE